MPYGKIVNSGLTPGGEAMMVSVPLWYRYSVALILIIVRMLLIFRRAAAF